MVVTSKLIAKAIFFFNWNQTLLEDFFVCLFSLGLFFLFFFLLAQRTFRYPMFLPEMIFYGTERQVASRREHFCLCLFLFLFFDFTRDTELSWIAGQIPPLRWVVLSQMETRGIKKGLLSAVLLTGPA